MTVRFYSSTATEKVLVGSITSGQTTLQVDSTVGLPTSFPYTLALDYQGLTEELVQVESAAGTTLTVTRAIDGTSSSTHASNARVRHVTSARDFADSRNHENSSTNVHGLTGGEEVVGTLKVQTLSNKTVIGLRGTFIDPDWTNVGPHAVTQTTTPAAAGTAIVFRMINGTDQQVEWKADGNLNVRNNVAMDTQSTTRRFQITMSNGTTERLYMTTAGTVVSIPRSGTADSNGGFTVLDPGDSTTRRAIQVRDSGDTISRFVVNGSGNTSIASTDPAQVGLNIKIAPAQVQPFLRVQDNASALQMQVDNGGMVEMRRKAFITNDLLPSGIVETVRGTTAQTADLTQWQNVGGSAVAHVRSDGSSDYTSLVTTTGIITPATGWTVSSQIAVVKGGFATIHIAMSRSGVALGPASGIGNLLGDPPFGTIAAAFRPHSGFGTSHLVFPFSVSLDDTHGGASYFANTGDITFDSMMPGSQIQTGGIAWMTMSYPLNFV